MGVSAATRALAAHADALWEAERAGRPIAPLMNANRHLTISDAYAIQRHNVERRIAAGRVVVGHKIGLTSRAMQMMLGVDEPDFGAILDDMLVEEGDPIRFDSLLQPKAEGELAVVLDHDLVGPGVTIPVALRAIAGVLPAIEVIDSRIVDWRITLLDTVADNASSGRVVIGSRLTPLEGLDLRLVGAVLSLNGDVVETGAGAAALGSPIRCVSWLANKLGELGSGLRAGEIVMTGALHRAIDVAAGDVVTAEFGGIGSVTVRFEPPAET